jgi:hypothetical protein
LLAPRSRRTTLPELSFDPLEVELAEEATAALGPESFRGRPCYIACVDLTGPADYLELVKSGLLAAVEALPPHCLFGLVVFGLDVGLFDLRSEHPAVRRIAAPAAGELELGLEEALPLSAFLVPVGDAAIGITMALESLTSLGPPASPDDPEDPDLSRQPGVAPEARRRCFGTCVAALVDYLAIYEGLASCRVLAFLSGVPNHGLGALDGSRISALAGRPGELLVPASAFYREQAERAVEIGVCFDVFVVSNRYTDLATIKFLCTKTGGKLMLYESTVNCTLPQDMYRQLSRPQASQGLLRLRTSPEFTASVHYGNLFADPGYDNLYHVVGCDDFSCFAVDFEFTDSSGFVSASERGGAIVQMAFAYTCVTAGDDGDGDGGGGGGGGGGGIVVRRRLRIVTVRAEASAKPRDILDRAEPDVVMALLSQKVIRAALDDGVDEARLLLQDWLAILFARFNTASGRAGAGDGSGSDVTVSFAGCPALVHLPRYVYGLLRHNVMAADNVHPDERIFLQVLFSSLQPHFLLNSVYPTLSSFSDPDTPADPVLCLARAAVDQCGARLFLMDAFTSIHVHALSGDVPPPQSALRTRVAELKLARHITPQVTVSRAGDSDGRHFVAGLIEDLPGAGGTFGEFLERVRGSVERAMAM